MLSVVASSQQQQLVALSRQDKFKPKRLWNGPVERENPKEKTERRRACWCLMDLFDCTQISDDKTRTLHSSRELYAMLRNVCLFLSIPQLGTLIKGLNIDKPVKDPVASH